MTWEIGLGIAALAVSAVGAGMQYDASQTAARNQAAMAEYNYAIQEQNIRQQQAIAQNQANYQARYQEAQGLLARQQAEANALAYDQQATATLQQGSEAAKRAREDYLRFVATQRAATAASGVATGFATPANNIIYGAALAQLTANDEWFKVNQQFMTLTHAAATERWGGEHDAAGFGTQAALARYEGSLAPISARMQLREAEYGRLAGLNQAANTRSAANAQLVSGFGTVLSSGWDMGMQAGWFKPSTAKKATAAA